MTPSNVQPQCAAATTPGTVAPSCGCGCGGGKAKQTVYVLGDRLWFDFGTLIRQSSIEDNFNGPIQTPEQLLRYLLGYNATEPSRKVGGNLFDAESVYWVLYQEDCPKYAIRPEGPFAATLYKAILTFFIENNDLGQADFLDECLRDFYNCHGGLSVPFRPFSGEVPGTSPATLPHSSHEAQSKAGGKPAAKAGPEHPLPPTPPVESAKTFDPGVETALIFGETASRASHIAIPGQITGQVRLLNGRTVPVLNPQLRGMASWNTLSLIDIAKQFLPGKDATTFITRIASRLYNQTNNDGTDPRDRAKNWAATHFIRSFAPLIQSQIFRDFVGMNTGEGTFVTTAVNDIVVKEPHCHVTGLEYDVEISLYDTENILRGLTVITTTVDVSDLVPVTTSKFRIDTRKA